MTPLTAALLGVLVGGLLTAAVLTVWFRVRADQQARILLDHMPKVSPQLVSILPLLRQPAVVVGPHDEVMHASQAANALGIARGSRVAVAEILDMIRQSRRSSGALTREIDIRRGTTQPQMNVLVSVAGLGDNGTMLVLAEDLTPAKRMDESRREFVANISHELKTPIGAVSALAETMQTAADDPDAVVHFAELMQAEAVRLGTLVGQIIDLSRLQADDPLLDALPVDLGDVVGEAVGRSRAVAASRKVSLVTTIEDDCLVVGDHAQLADAVSNLVSNAINYSDPGARVAVSTRHVHRDGDDLVEVAVADNGIGIRLADQEHVFERFYRVDYGRSRASGGTGLGLSIVRHIAEAHGGAVTLWSRPGQGSTFTISLPAMLPTPEGDS